VIIANTSAQESCAIALQFPQGIVLHFDSLITHRKLRICTAFRHAHMHKPLFCQSASIWFVLPPVIVACIIDMSIDKESMIRGCGGDTIGQVFGSE
jgi:hypothetical protein